MFRLRPLPPDLSAAVEPATAVTRIAACADSDAPAQQAVFAAIARSGPDAVLFAGDASYAGRSDRGRRESLRRWREDWGPLERRVYAVPGNHDFESPRGLAVWRHAMLRARGVPPELDGLAFAVRVGPVLAIGLTARRHLIGDDQLAWAAARLGEDDAPHRVAVVHEPPWPCGRRRGGSLDRHPEARDRLWRVFEDGGVRLVVCGHEHGYARRLVTVRRPIQQVISAGAGATLYADPSPEADVVVPAHHYLLVEADEEGMHCQAIALDGRVLDEVDVPGDPTPAAGVEVDGGGTDQWGVATLDDGGPDPRGGAVGPDETGGGR